jgi:hypothetical protein
VVDATEVVAAKLIGDPLAPLGPGYVKLTRRSGGRTIG